MLELWRRAEKNGALPDNSELGRALRLVNFRDILLSTGKFSVRLNYPGQSLDLGAIAKGYAADEVHKIFRSERVHSALIDLGGNIIAMGLRPDGRKWRIGIQHPGKPRGHFIGMVDVQDKTVVTSGNQGEYPEMKKTAHSVIDTRTGYPVLSGLSSVTVISDNSIDADALSTAAFSLGLDWGRKLIERFPGTEAVFITEDHKVSVTDGLKPDFELLDKQFTPSENLNFEVG